MARIRYIKPEFWKDEDIAELDPLVRLFYIGLWNFADKAGRLEYRPKWLKVEIFPYDNTKVEKLISVLGKKKNNSNRSFIQIYKNGEKEYIQILAWDTHQKPHHQEPESKLPTPPIYNNINTTLTKTITIKGSVLDEPTPNQHRTNTEQIQINEIINDLNLVLGTHYRADTKNTITLIEKLLKKYTVEDFKIVHRKKFKEWGNDSKMAAFLRPETLYSPKFESYLNTKEVKDGKSNKYQEKSDKFKGIGTTINT